MKTILLQTINEEKHSSWELAELPSINVTDFDIDQLSDQLMTLPSLMIFDKHIDVINVLKVLSETTRRYTNPVEWPISLT